MRAIRCRLCLGLVVLALVLAFRAPAGASWYVSDITYTTGTSALCDEDVTNGAVVVIGHVQRTGGNGWFKARVVAIGVSQEGSTNITSDTNAQGLGTGFSNLNARVWLSGAPPPPRPATWGTKAFAHAHSTFSAGEVGSILAADCGGHGLSKVGLIGHNPPTVGWSKGYSWNFVDGVSKTDGGECQLNEASYVARTTQSPYICAWVYARASAYVSHGFGTVEAVTWTYVPSDADWGIVAAP